MREPVKKLPVMFYRSTNGVEPVRDWLREFSRLNRGIIGFDIATAEFGWPVGMPICRSLGAGLWEIRSNLSQGRISRVIFCVSEGHMVLLNGFLKKTQKTPESDLGLARKRQRELKK